MVKAIAEESAGLNPHIKEGSYLGRLAGVFEKELEVRKTDERGNVLSTEKVERWEWTLGVRSKEGDIRMTVLTSPKISTKSKAYGFVKALRGGDVPELGMEVNTDDLIGRYATLTVKDKPRKDMTGNIQVSSEITDMLPVDEEPETEIVIEGLAEEPDVEAPAPPEPPKEPPKAPAQLPKKQKK